MAANTGPEQLRALGIKLKTLGAAGMGQASSGLSADFGKGKTLRAQLLAGIRTAAQPLVNDVRQAAREQLPRHGGLNESVANSKTTVATRLTGPRVGVRIKNSSHGGRGANKGLIKHPVYGVWRTGTPWQNDPASVGWFDRTLANQAPKVMVSIRASMEVIAIEATRRL